MKFDCHKFIDLVNNTIDINIESKVLKTLEDDAASKLIAKMIDSRPTHLIIKKIPIIFKISDYNIQTNRIRI